MGSLTRLGLAAKESEAAVQTDIAGKAAAQPPHGLRHYDDLPGPRGILLLGNALQIEAPRFHRQLKQWCGEYGPFFKLQVGRRKMLVVGDHQVAASLLRDRPDGLRRTSRFEEICIEMSLPLGVFAANGDTWRRQRRMVMAGFDPAHVMR